MTGNPIREQTLLFNRHTISIYKTFVGADLKKLTIPVLYQELKDKKALSRKYYYISKELKFTRAFNVMLHHTSHSDSFPLQDQYSLSQFESFFCATVVFPRMGCNYQKIYL